MQIELTFDIDVPYQCCNCKYWRTMGGFAGRCRQRTGLLRALFAGGSNPLTYGSMPCVFDKWKRASNWRLLSREKRRCKGGAWTEA